MTAPITVYPIEHTYHGQLYRTWQCTYDEPTGLRFGYAPTAAGALRTAWRFWGGHTPALIYMRRPPVEPDPLESVKRSLRP